MLRSAICITGCLFLARVGALGADEVPGVITPLQVSLVQEPVHFKEPVFRAYVTAGGAKYAFVVPKGFHVQGDPLKGTLTLVNAQGNSTLTFAVLDPAPSENRILNSATYRELLAGEHTNANVLRELSLGTAGRSGPGFDLEWKVNGNLIQTQRAVFIPSAAGVLEFTATTTRSSFAGLKDSLDLILATFACGTNGKLEVFHFADKS